MDVIAREGTSAVGLHFMSNQAVYFPRGWIRSIEMVDGGPQEFVVYFNNTVVAATTNGKITRESFTAEAIADMDAKTSPDDQMHSIPKDMFEGLFNITPFTRIVFETPEPPRRQNYYVRQGWVQLFRRKDGAKGTADIDFEPVPCTRLFNLFSFDRTATIAKTIPVNHTDASQVAV